MTADTTPPPSAAVPDPADVEKVARAIRSVDYFADPRSWEADVEANRERYRRLAVAALAAVRDLADVLDRDAAEDEDEGWAAGQRYSAARIRPALGTGDRGQLCHCGELSDAARGRGMCLRCDDVRCDAYPGACQSRPVGGDTREPSPAALGTGDREGGR